MLPSSTLSFCLLRIPTTFPCKSSVFPNCFVISTMTFNEPSSFWYESTLSTYTKDDREALRQCVEIPHDHRVRVLTSDQRPYLRPIDFTAFFYDQLVGGLRFPIPTFFCDIFKYYHIPLQQLASNSFRLLCIVAIVFQLYQISLSPKVFHYFFYPRSFVSLL